MGEPSAPAFPWQGLFWLLMASLACSVGLVAVCAIGEWRERRRERRRW